MGVARRSLGPWSPKHIIFMIYQFYKKDVLRLSEHGWHHWNANNNIMFVWHITQSLFSPTLSSKLGPCQCLLPLTEICMHKETSKFKQSILTLVSPVSSIGIIDNDIIYITWQWSYMSMGAIRWGIRGTCPPTFSDGEDIICDVPPHFFLYVLYLERFRK